MSARIAHLLPNSTFLPFTVEVFEAAVPGASTFLVHGFSGDLSRHPQLSAVPAEVVTADAAGLERASAVTRDSDIAIFHSVGEFAAQALIDAAPDTLTVWSGWGGDYYGTDWSATAGLLDPITARNDQQRGTLPGRLLRSYRRWRPSRVLHRAAGDAKVFSAPIPDDLAVFRSRFPGFSGRYAQLNYASVEDTYTLGVEAAVGDDILVGNSATPPNNHLDVFELLAQADVTGRRIITPLSYGDTAYADAVTARGRELFGEAFVPLRTFLPLGEYQALIAGASTFVMGHRRQQAVGNVASALWTGSRVILHDRSPLFAFLCSRGAHVSPLSAVAKTGIPRGRASEDELAENRRVLLDFWGRERVLANIRELIESV